MSMRTTKRIGLVTGAALAVAAVVGAAAGAPDKGGTVTVQVMSAKVMKDPSFLGTTVATVVRGEHLTYQDSQKDWYKVTTSAGKDGWINKTSVVDKALTLSTKPGGGTGGVSEDEVALAGRGFSPEVEKQYRSQHPDLDYSHVDAI